LCTWLIDISVEDIEVSKGYVDGQHVEVIIDGVRALRPRAYVVPSLEQGESH
jgi:hypothetical protein